MCISMSELCGEQQRYMEKAARNGTTENSNLTDKMALNLVNQLQWQ